MYMPTPPVQPTTPTQPTDNEQDDGVDNANAEVEVNDEIQRSFMCFTILNIQTLRRGTLFPDIISFRKAVSHAIVRDFEFAGLQTDPTRFIAKYAHKGCPWRIHASRLQGQSAIQV